MAIKTYDYALTFEFESQAPITTHGQVQGSTLQAVAKRALQDARAKHKNVSWQSLVLVLDKHRSDTPVLTGDGRSTAA